MEQFQSHETVSCTNELQKDVPGDQQDIKMVNNELDDREQNTMNMVQLVWEEVIESSKHVEGRECNKYSS